MQTFQRSHGNVSAYMQCSTAYCWGNFAGPFVVKDSEAPTYPTATAGLLAGYAIKLGCHLMLLGEYTAYESVWTIPWLMML